MRKYRENMKMMEEARKKAQEKVKPAKTHEECLGLVCAVCTNLNGLKV